MPKKKKHNIGIALGGGGARGFAHLGALQALSEKGIKPDIISGVSAGAIAGAFIAAGKSPKDAFDIIKKYKFTDLTAFNIPKTGLFSHEKMRMIVKNNIKVDNIEDLDTPLMIGATDMLAGKIEYFSTGFLADRVEASAAIPALYSPVEIDGKLYSDGGIFDNVPIRPLKGKAEKIIAISISPIQEIQELKSMVQVATRMFQLAVNQGTDELKKQCDIFIEPVDLCNYDVMDTKHAKTIFEIGYEHTKAMDINL
ncbi:MAG: patatin-like phospholipase family protein [Ekhidna sp.]